MSILFFSLYIFHVQKTVIKVNVNCQKCKQDLLKSVTKLSGIDQISVDGEKQTLTVVGDVDPVFIVKKIRKSRKCAEIVSVGPPKDDDKKKIIECCLPPYCNDCQMVAVSYAPYDGGICNIL
ncbi:hypothetical protein UlMin_036652 [Ulmus minor]